MNFLKTALLFVCTLAGTYGYAQDDTSKAMTGDNGAVCSSGGCCCAGNSQAPLGVMTDHIHDKGQWMLSYTYMDMNMKGDRTGATPINDNDIYQNYMMAPESMNMQMHMLMAMYGVTDKLTVMVMGGYISYNMTMKMALNMPNMPGMVMTPGNLNMQSMSSGFTDTKVYGLYNFSNNANQHIIGSIGINLPTGSIKATGTTILGNDQQLPYDMQPGSGSFGVAPGITYTRKYGLFYWGADVGADIKLNYNSRGYKDGNIYHATAWAGYQFLPFVSGTLRAEDTHTDMVSGEDRAVAIPIYETNDPTTKTSNYGGTWMNIYAGLNFHSMKPALERFRLMAEYGIPVYQNLNGTQMSLRANLLAGLQCSF